jgi:phosphatidate phosphatase LPIN
LEGRKRRGGSKEYKEYEDVDHSAPEHQEKKNIDFDSGAENQKKEAALFGTGGTLSASDDDLTTLILNIDGRKVEFQLSLVGDEYENHDSSLKRPVYRDEMEAARLFDTARVDLTKLLDDENVTGDPRLMIRWARDQCVALPFMSSQQLICCDDRYITRDDGSPLMDALVYWRASTLEKRVADGFRQLPSPLPSSPIALQHQQREPIVDQQAHIRSQSEPPYVAEMRKIEEQTKIEAMTTTGGKGNGVVSLETNSINSAKKPTSSSWVQWWSRSRKKDLGVANVKDTTRDVEDVKGVLDSVRLSYSFVYFRNTDNAF